MRVHKEQVNSYLPNLRQVRESNEVTSFIEFIKGFQPREGKWHVINFFISDFKIASAQYRSSNKVFKKNGYRTLREE